MLEGKERAKTEEKNKEGKKIIKRLKQRKKAANMQETD